MMEILSGPLYFRFLISQAPLTHERVVRVLDVLLAGMTRASPGSG